MDAVEPAMTAVFGLVPNNIVETNVTRPPWPNVPLLSLMTVEWLILALKTTLRLVPPVTIVLRTSPTVVPPLGPGMRPGKALLGLRNRSLEAPVFKGRSICLIKNLFVLPLVLMTTRCLANGPLGPLVEVTFPWTPLRRLVVQAESRLTLAIIVARLLLVNVLGTLQVHLKTVLTLLRLVLFAPAKNPSLPHLKGRRSVATTTVVLAVQLPHRADTNTVGAAERFILMTLTVKGVTLVTSVAPTLFLDKWSLRLTVTPIPPLSPRPTPPLPRNYLMKLHLTCAIPLVASAVLRPLAETVTLWILDLPRKVNNVVPLTTLLFP